MPDVAGTLGILQSQVGFPEWGLLVSIKTLGLEHKEQRAGLECAGRAWLHKGSVLSFSNPRWYYFNFSDGKYKVQRGGAMCPAAHSQRMPQQGKALAKGALNSAPVTFLCREGACG